MNKSRLNGKRAVPLLRCSTMEQSETSIDDQLNSIRAFADRMDMELGEPVRLAGKSGSIKKNLEEMVDQVINRKQGGERIDAVVYFDQSRFGRSGPLHFGHLADRLSREAIELAEADAYIEDRETADLVRMIKAEAAKRQAKSISEASARGSQSSLLAGRRSHSYKPAFGIDKLYMSAAGDERVIVRQLQDGSRVEINPQTGAFGQRYKKGVRGYRKGALEIDTLVPGDPAAREIIIRIFRMHHEQGFGGTKIAQILNDESIPSPTGSTWSKTTIEGLLLNEVYLGLGYANRISNAIYCNQSPGMPRTLESQEGRLIRGIRPREDWHVIEYPRLKEFLPKDLREMAMAEQSAYRDRIAAGYIKDPKKANGRRCHLLSGLMTEMTTGRELKGIRSGSRNELYYGMSGRIETIPSGSPLRRRLPAAPLHRILLEEIESILCSFDDFEGLIRSEIHDQDQARRGSPDEARQLECEREKLKRRRQSQLDLLGELDDNSVRESIVKASSRINAIDARLAAIDAGPRLSPVEIEQVARGVMDDLRGMLKRLAEDGDTALRTVVEAMVGKAVADLEAGEVDFEFAVPGELIEQRIRGLPSSRRSTTCRQAHKWTAIHLSSLTVELPERCSGDCWEPFEPRGCDNCRREKDAA